MRYRFEYNKQVYFGITAEKDPGEPFFRLYNRKGYDFYSAYLYLQDVGRFKSLALGNYKASFGYGLVMNMVFSMGKYTSSSSLRRTGQGISKYTSTAEYNYLQGVAATYRLAKRWDATLFYSFRNMDARVENQFIRSLKTDGYHRLYKDMEKSPKVQRTFGLLLRGLQKLFQCGLPDFGYVGLPDLFAGNGYPLESIGCRIPSNPSGSTLHVFPASPCKRPKRIASKPSSGRQPPRPETSLPFNRQPSPDDKPLRTPQQKRGTCKQVPLFSFRDREYSRT